MEKFKKKKEEQEKVRLEEALDEFCQTFEEGGLVKVPKTFIRGDVVNANKTVKSSTGNGSELAIYKPTPVIQISAPKPAQGFETARKIAEETAKKIMKEAVGEKAKPAEPSPISRPPKPGTKKVVEKSRLTNLEAFKEELKHMQAMRDERKGLRQQLKEKLGVADEELNRIAPSLDAPYTGPGVPANVDFENDPSTTNLYACNLPSDAKLEDFFETFGTFGPLASAKILYPKPDEERHWNTLSGFVAFMNRKDAERALCAMHGDVIRGCELRVSWARQVLMPPVPFYVPPTLRELSMPDPPSGLPFNAKPTSEDLRLFLQRYHDLPKLGASMEDSNAAMVADYKKMIENATVRVVIPTERPLLQLIHRVVEFLVRSGPLFEAILMARERKNTMYRFLFDNHHPTHVYYRWRLYTVLQGDDPQRWRLDKFKMFEGGSWWQPPPHALFELGMPPQLYDTAYIPKRRRDRGAYEKRHMPMKRESDDEGEDRESRRKRALKDDLEREERQKRLRGILSDKDREELEGLLRNLTAEKTAIGDAMVWCLDHAECSKEIAQCIAESLCLKETPLHKKIARIYMVSDILANCAVRIKDAFYYRQHFGAYLQKIFIQLNESLESIESRLKAEQFRQRVMLCFRNWEDHAIYPTHDLIQWQNIFLGLLKAQTNVDSSIDGEPMVSEEFDEEIGVPIPEDGVDIDGVLRAMEGFVEEEEEIDGIPMDENLSIAESDVNQEQGTRFTTGSWSTIEPEETIINTKTSIKSKWESKWDHHQGSVAAPFSIEQQQQEEEEGPIRKKHKLTRLSPSPSKETKMITTTGTQAATNLKASKGEIGEAVDEEMRRKLLREIELKVMKLQDELESDTANISAAQIESEIANYRAKLMARMEEKLHESVADEGRRESRGARRQKSPDKKVEGRRNSTTSKRTEDERERGREHNGRRERNETKSREYSRTRNRSRNRERSRSRERDRDRERSRERDSDRDRREHDRDRDNRRRGRSRSNSPESRRRL